MKKFKNRVILIIGTALLALLTAIGIFAAGQYFSVIPHPEFVASGCVIGIVLLVIGIIIGNSINKPE